MSHETIEKETEQEAKRRRLMKEKPEEFIHQSEIVMAVLKTDKGQAICHGAVPRVEMEAALTRLGYRTYSLFNQMDMAAMLKSKESEIITAPGSGKIIV